MPSRSKAQQRLFGQAWAVRKGDLPKSSVGKEVKKIADSDMTDKQIKAFASTKHKGLPDYVKENLLGESVMDQKSAEAYIKEMLKGDIWGIYGLDKKHWETNVEFVLQTMYNVLAEEHKYSKAHHEEDELELDDLMKAITKMMKLLP